MLMSIYKRVCAKYSGWEKLMSVAVILLLISSFSVYSQSDRRSRRNRLRQQTEQVKDTVQISDSMRAARDSARRADSTARADSINLLGKSSIDRPAFSAARDSIIEDFSNGRQMMYYYGDVTVTYGNMKLTADYMEYDMKTQTVYARGTRDTSGVITGQPQMEDGGKTYTMEEVRYNF